MSMTRLQYLLPTFKAFPSALAQPKFLQGAWMKSDLTSWITKAGTHRSLILPSSHYSVQDELGRQQACPEPHKAWIHPQISHICYTFSPHTISTRSYKLSSNYSAQPKQDRQKTENQNKDLKHEIKTDLDVEASDDQHKSIFVRFKEAYKTSGKVLVAVHVVTSCVWFGSFFSIVYAGVDVVAALKWVGVSDWIISPFESSGLGDVAVAYLMYKLATPARYTVTLVGTQYTIRYLRHVGYLEPVPEGSRIRDLVKESGEQVKGKYVDLKEDIKEKREEYKEKYEEKLEQYKDRLEDSKDKLKDKFSEDNSNEHSRSDKKTKAKPR